ncbi:MAG: dockerin [Deltaproteobacteria bacterium]|nr:dockerin [Deltaproteobacteria bacterium]
MTVGPTDRALRRLALLACGLLGGCFDAPAPGAPSDAGDEVASDAPDAQPDAPADDGEGPDRSDTPDTKLDAPAADLGPPMDAPEAATDGPGTGELPASLDAPGMEGATDVARDTAAEGAVGEGGVRPARGWVGIIGTGQSLSVGASAAAVLHGTQPYGNLMLRDEGAAPLYDGAGDRLSLAPLVEPLRPRFSGAGYPAPPLYPNNIYGETPHAAFALELTTRARAALGEDYVTVHSVVGESGRSITSIERMGTGRAYAATLYEVRAITDLARRAGQPYAVRAVLLTHGETDANRASYAADVYRLYTDYLRDLRAITGQTAPLVMLVSQQGTFPNTAGSRAISTLAPWRLGVDHPGEVLCTGPRYQYQYAADRVHFDAYGYTRLGIKYAQVFEQAAVRGVPWRPLQPRAARRAGRVLTIEFDVPVPPLAWDTSIPAPHQTAFTEWAQGRGFEVEGAAGRLRIEDARLTGASVEVVLREVPAGPVTVRYAMTQDGDGFAGGPMAGRRGQLRDSDRYVGADREALRVRVTAGSARVEPVTPGAFVRRGVRDLVEGPGIAGETSVTARADTAITLSRPWAGASGEATLTFHSDQRNYCVHFELTVP